MVTNLRNKLPQETTLYVYDVIQSLVKENFRAVAVATGDSLGAVLNDQGELRIWGTFRVCFFHCSLTAANMM